MKSFKKIEDKEWFRGNGGVAPKIIIPFTKQIFFLVYKYQLQEVYHIEYMYEGEVLENTYYTSICDGLFLDANNDLGLPVFDYEVLIRSEGENDVSDAASYYQVLCDYDAIMTKEKALFIVMKGKDVKNTENNIEVKSNVKPCYFQSNMSHLNYHVSSLCNNGLHVDYKTCEKKYCVHHFL